MKNVSDCSRKSSFPTLKPRKKSLVTQRSSTHWSWWIPSLIVMDTFQGQNNAKIKALYLNNDCELVIVPHNLTNKFQPLDIKELHLPLIQRMVRRSCQWAVKRRCSSRWCESIEEKVRLEISACALDSWYVHLPKATERIDSEWIWQSWHNRGCQVSKWSIREDWKPFRWETSKWNVNVDLHNFYWRKHLKLLNARVFIFLYILPWSLIILLSFKSVNRI